jgi:tetratricopeptide (TPR) repeat protein
LFIALAALLFNPVTAEKTLAQKDYQVEKAYNNLITRGDSLFEAKDYQGSMKAFQKAARLKPLEEYPHLKMQVIETMTGMEKFYDKPGDKKDEPSQPAEETEEVPVAEETGEELETGEAELPPPLQDKTAIRDSIRRAILALYQDTLAKLDDKDDRLIKSVIYNQIGDTFNAVNDNPMAIEFYQKALMVEVEEGDMKSVGKVYKNMGDAYYKSGNFDSSIETYEKSVEAKVKTGDKKGASDVMTNIGNVYETTYEMDKALDYYERSAEIKDDIDDKEGMSKVMDNIGNIYYQKKILPKSIESYIKSATLQEQTNKKDELGETYNKLGVAYAEMGKFEEAENYYERSFDLNENLGNKKESSMALNNLGNINFNQNKYKKAINYYEKSLSIKEDENYNSGKAVSLFNLANAYRRVNDYEKASELYETSMKLAEENNLSELKAKSIKGLASVFTETKQLDKAEEYTVMLASTGLEDVNIDDPVSERTIIDAGSEPEDMIKYLTEEILRQKQLFELEAEKREKENKINMLRLQNQDEQIKKQRVFLISLTAVVLLVLAVLFLLKKQVEQKKKANMALREKNQTISKQKKLITDNITSASYIQRAALPPDETIATDIGEHLILNLPKDIVSGDFYWVEKKGSKVYIAVADCTGHGVQGAIVSMLGISLLNEIVNKNYKSPTGELLDQLSQKVKLSLHQQGTDIEDIREGMDIVFCKLDKDTLELEYSTANNPIYVVRGSELIELKGNRSPIGYYSKKINFKTETAKLQKGDTIYMFSDGYADQLGGDQHKKFLSKRFKNLLVEIDSKPLTERREILHQKHVEWRGKYSQVDDIIVMGVKL